MRAVIRFLSRSASGTTEQRDRIFEGDSVTLGRATDQVLHLKDRRVALRHARIFRHGDRLLITSAAVSGVILNGAVVRDASLEPGDTVAIGSNTLKFFPPPAGFDLAFTFELDAAARTSEAEIERPRLRLAELGLHKRAWSWVLFMLVALAALVLPALAVKHGSMQTNLRGGPWPDDSFWTSGRLSDAHHTLTTQCDKCHERPFVRVRNEACLACHSDSLHRHAAPTVTFAALDAARCTTCHVEHNEPATLVRRDSTRCIDCHATRTQAAGTDEEIFRATDFARDHPPFRVSMLLLGETPPEAVRVLPEKSAQGERSRLIFPHDTHLDPAGIKAPSGTVVMKCADCHQPEEGGVRMRPIRMEEHCQSCHRLDFEPADPDRQVPHGDPKRVVETLIEYYSARYLDNYPDPLATARPAYSAQRPGRALDEAARARALQLARAKARTTARDLIERRTCVDCHQVTALAGSAGTPQWNVESVLLTREWMPKARFSHAAHSTTLTSCDHCHAAPKSHEASDILMPAIGTCRDCHGGEQHTASKDRVPSECTLCHAFHVPDNPLWVERTLAREP